MDKLVLNCDRSANLSLIPHLFDRDQCKNIIQLINESDEKEQLRNRTRVITDRPDLAASIWEQMSDWLIDNYGEITDNLGDVWECSGINERFRLIKYKGGDNFNVHEDGVYWKEWNERSFVTFMVYLNDVEEEDGGATHFLDHGIRVQPKEGLCVVFKVDGLLHCGEPLLKGEKYLFRTDIMYRLKTGKDEEILKSLYDIMKTAEDTSNYKLWDTYHRIKANYCHTND
jgi:2OG-Fe(II) oxygenase superfamily